VKSSFSARTKPPSSSASPQLRYPRLLRQRPCLHHYFQMQTRFSHLLPFLRMTSRVRVTLPVWKRNTIAHSLCVGVGSSGTASHTNTQRMGNFSGAEHKHYLRQITKSSCRLRLCFIQLIPFLSSVRCKHTKPFLPCTLPLYNFSFQRPMQTHIALSALFAPTEPLRFRCQSSSCPRTSRVRPKK